MAPGVVHDGFARLNETEQRWEVFGCINPPWGGMQHLMPRETTGQPNLYATGFSYGLCGYPEACVFRYTGNGFAQWPPWQEVPSSSSNYVGDVFDYRGKTYVTGSFRNPIGPGFSYLMRHNGSAWEEVPGWSGIVKDFTIHRDTLYIAGVMQVAQGSPGNGIVAYDGQQWHQLGAGVTLFEQPQYTVVRCLKWFHDELYVGGQFSRASGVQATGLAKWNRQQWCSLPGFEATGFNTPYTVNSMAVWRDSLYINGLFTELDGQPVVQVVRWIGGDAASNCSQTVGMPQPSPTACSIAAIGDGRFTITFPTNGTRRLEVFDALGKCVHRQGLLGESASVDLGALTTGAFLLRVTDANGQAFTAKLWGP